MMIISSLSRSSGLKLPAPNKPDPSFWAILLIEFLLFRGRLELLPSSRVRWRFVVAANVPPERVAFVKVDLAEEVAVLLREATAGEAAGAWANTCGR